ncbi:MAG: alpha-amylase family glycosyl hydrolase [Thermoanaerobaculia bacterium]
MGLIEKIPYLLSLGVTTVELLPLLEFDETENHRRNPETGERLVNFWGYSPVSFFAPKASYAADLSPGAAQRELMALVDALHLAGIEIVVDVVYNHTAEGGGGATDPLHSFRGLAPDVYYLRDAAGRPLDVTGCGNTVNTNHPVVRRLILDSLRFWAEEIGVDGFRFDLAAAFFRGLEGEKLARSPLADEIASDPLLSRCLLIAEPWDVTGFSPGDAFPAPWRVWNGRFRDDIRRYVRGDEVGPRALARRLVSSPPAIDFVTCHDGFTARDLVSYAEKHNLENGEDNRDGSGFNLSSNHGFEGEVANAELAALRRRQVRNLLLLLLLSRATPMLLAGDERGRSQNGNNNAWCQDNPLSWIDWRLNDSAEALCRCVAGAIALRRELSRLAFREWSEIAGFTDIESREAGVRAVALVTRDAESGRALLLALNPTDRAARFPVPRSAGAETWVLAADSCLANGGFGRATERPRLAAETAELAVQPRSIRLLLT